MVVLLPTNEPS